jgi:D-3-phosphoglycerate dehydrogenase
MGGLLKGKMLGIIGLGKIGKRVAHLAKAFGARVLFYDVKQVKGWTEKKVSLNELFRRSDIISIHSSTKERLIGEKEISKMKKGVILINTARGEVINENSLYKGLLSGKIAYAALDVYNNEPYSGKLSSLDNVILTPHIGSYAKEARIKMEVEAARNLIKGLKACGESL